jgi:tRNA1(Val) A37 N6-methylase TrmN6
MLRLEAHYERLFGIKTMEIKKSDNVHNFHYQGASYMVLFDILKKLPHSAKQKNFIDIGSGKGRALFCAEYSGFDHLIGVELDQELVEIAKENAEHYRLKRNESRFTFICENALTYVIPEGTAVFYFFNPFSENIMQEVEKKISAYKMQDLSEIFIIYVNPRFKNVWINAGYETYHQEGNSRYTEALIFRKKSD